ncbi:hypothetical protein [Vibrio metschnikovii]|uniref:hypothetical protein n=1 Tax=Vibrio metschnikovii TaxID=28172 RepID=UPI00164B46F6|nr:hypothetical protein [Vibrio metschnikovii]MBC5832140.1 hypothetical protein [Vibrio metschnikovii]
MTGYLVKGKEFFCISTSSLLKLILTLIVFFTLMPIKLGVYTVVIQLFLCVCFLFFCNLSFRYLLFAILGTIGLILLALFSLFIDLKITLLFVFFVLMSCNVDCQDDYLTTPLKIALNFIFIVSFFQFLFPYPFWYCFAENDGHLHLFKVGYSVYSTLGSSTHSAYITLLIGSYLLYVKGESKYYFVITLISLVLFSNKVCILVFLFISFAFFFLKSDFNKKMFVIFLSVILLFFLWKLIFESYYIAWSTTDLHNIHTISHRLNLIKDVAERASHPEFWFIGEPSYISYFGLAFDSAVILLFFRYGIFFTIYIYLVMLIKVGFRYHIFYLSIILPSVTQVSFYNTQFLILISLMLVFIKKKSNGDINAR